LFREFSPGFFDLIVIDECHRGSAADDAAWREILEYFSAAHSDRAHSHSKRDEICLEHPLLWRARLHVLLDTRHPGWGSRSLQGDQRHQHGAWRSRPSLKRGTTKQGAVLSNAQIAERMQFEALDETTNRRKAARYVQAGRKLLNDLAVVPWTLWLDGMVAADWWRSREFFIALDLWYGWILTHAPRLRQLIQISRHAADVQRALEGKLQLVPDGNYELDLIRRRP
jgi:hypothetical protein